tara:strand:- start:3 stop:956 length:954 start_codon:yes stop_codon:yes gene_type:complete
MAILRGGRRIGNTDIRIGIPRDRSLDNVQGDRRLSRVQGNPESTIGRFQSKMAEGEGFARPSRFMVDFILPKGLDEQATNEAGADQFTFQEEVQRSTLPGQLQAETELQRGLRAFCFNAELPSRNVDTAPMQVYGPKREIVYGHSYTQEITLSFYADKFLRQRSFFELWQNAAMDLATNNVHFYDEYTGAIRIYALGAFSGDAFRDRIAYGVHLYECYPKTITAVPLNYGTQNEIMQINVSFYYRNWSNLSIDEVRNYTVGGGFKKPTVKYKYGAFGKLLSKLPPEIRRAGRDAVNVIRQRVPIGSVFGGKVFPPFL